MASVMDRFKQGSNIMNSRHGLAGDSLAIGGDPNMRTGSGRTMAGLYAMDAMKQTSDSDQAEAEAKAEEQRNLANRERIAEIREQRLDKRRDQARSAVNSANRMNREISKKRKTQKAARKAVQDAKKAQNLKEYGRDSFGNIRNKNSWSEGDGTGIKETDMDRSGREFSERSDAYMEKYGLEKSSTISSRKADGYYDEGGGGDYRTGGIQGNMSAVGAQGYGIEVDRQLNNFQRMRNNPDDGRGGFSNYAGSYEPYIKPKKRAKKNVRVVENSVTFGNPVPNNKQFMSFSDYQKGGF